MTMARLWILHRDPRWREALRRAAGAVDLLAADPSAAGVLENEPAPRAVLLGVAGDFEPELELTHRLGARLPASTVWILLAAPRDLAEVRRLFDALPAEVVPLSSDASELRRRVRVALARRPSAALTERRRRDALAARFGRWLGDVELPALLTALDPRRRNVPLLVRGERGTGRSLVARYVHWMAAGGAPGAFASVATTGAADARALLGALAPEAGELRAGDVATVCIEDLDLLAPSAQRQVRGWIEHGPPAGALAGTQLRWIATAGDPETEEERLDPDLGRALAGLEIRLPPLRERPEAIERIARSAVAGWCAAHGEPPRDFSPDAIARLRSHGWPGNLRELEAVIRRTLAATRSDPIRAADLRFDPVPPLAPELVAELLEEPHPALDRATPPLWQSPGEMQDQAPTPPGQSDRPEHPPQGAEGAAQRAEGERSSSGRAAAQQPTPNPDASVRRLAGAVAHEVGNPLVGIRSYAQMLPSRFDDAEFRRQFAERVDADTRRIESVLDTLERLGSLPAPIVRPVDVSALLARLLELQRRRIQERRLVVLEELDRERPQALADSDQLRFAFGLLLEQTLAWIPDRGDLYVATRHRPGTAGEGARLRILLRLRSGVLAAAEPGLSVADNTLAVAAVDAVVRAQGGTLAIESVEAGETLVLVELPAFP
jgi:DNA-binding NtrC family response regulator